MLGMSWGGEAAGFGVLLALLLAVLIFVAALNTYVLSRFIFKRRHRLLPVAASLVLFIIFGVLRGWAPHLPEILVVTLAHLIVLARFKAWRIGAG